MSSTDAPTGPLLRGRKPAHPVGHERRLAIGWLHEYDTELPEPTYPVDLSGGSTTTPMWGNGPDPDLTITTINGPSGPVGDCYKAGKANDEFIEGNPNHLSSDVVVENYEAYEASSQGVPLGDEQDEGVVMSDALLWDLTHDWAGNEVPLGQGAVEVFVPVEPATAGAVMAKYRKRLLMGADMTGADEKTFPALNAGPNNPPDPNMGHVLLLELLNGALGTPTGSGGPRCWTLQAKATAAWMTSCPQELWLVLTGADRERMGAEAFDALVADCYAEFERVQGIPVPSPESPPAPPAPAPAPPAAPPPSVPTEPPAAPPPANPGPPPPSQYLDRVEKWIEEALRYIEALEARLG